MSTQNETSAFILEQLPNCRIVKRPKKAATPRGETTRWIGRIADESGTLHTVEVVDTEPRTISITPYASFGKDEGE